MMGGQVSNNPATTSVAATMPARQGGTGSKEHRNKKRRSGIGAAFNEQDRAQGG